MLTLKLFNAVLAKPGNEIAIDETNGLLIEKGAAWCKKEIINYYTTEKLNGNDLNKTFHKSWKKIKESSEFELWFHQVLHYFSTYGTGFQGEVYIPKEALNVPSLNKIKFKVIKALTKEQLIEKSLDILKFGIALKEETVNELLSLLIDKLNYKFTGNEGIKNKEAIVKLAEVYEIYPSNPVEFFRYIIYRTVNETLLIKNDELINKIKQSNYNPACAFKNFGEEKLAEIFNRFKPLFLAYKSKCPSTINKISKLSKTCHKPLVENALNAVTKRLLTDKDKHWLNNATPYALFKALNAVYLRSNGQDSFVYRVRNGKSYIKEAKTNSVNKANYEYLSNYLKERIDLSGLKVFIPKGVKYALPTSEKMFIGNIPTGTKFYGKNLAVGIYWENKWGARDLDLSGINIGGKVGWNTSYRQESSLYYSGDMTSAPNGAVEYLRATKKLNEPTLVMNNVFSGSDTCQYKIVVGRGSDVNKSYMMDPNKLFAEVKCQSVQKQSILGILLQEDEKQAFVLLNFGAGHSRVSGHSKSELATKALYQAWKNPISFNKLIKTLGAEIVEEVENANVDLSLNNLEKDSFVKIFKK